MRVISRLPSWRAPARPFTEPGLPVLRLRSVLPGVDEALDALQIARGDFTCGEQMADQRRDVAPEQPVGEPEDHRTTDFLLRYERAVHEVSAFRPAGGGAR